MEYQPITCVWEVTMGCNMRCGHCGSSCAEPLPDELAPEEALDLCDQIADIGLKWVTLSGGEPLTRRDTPELIKRLAGHGVAVNVITNGWLLKPELAKKLKDSGISTVAISIDGTEEVHDKIRKTGAFAHAKAAFATMQELGIDTGAVTTITKQNMDILNDIKEALIAMGVHTWQVQLGLPMGNLKERPDWLLEPSQVDDIMEFCYQTAKEGRIRIFPADCIGYYTKKEMEIKKISYQTDNVAMWDGCNAGTRGFGILQNGDILGCTSIRDAKFIEGNIKERPLREIWEDKNTFLWRRNLTKELLGGTCRTCRYGFRCLGGCPNTRLTMNQDIYSENQYCAYQLSLERIKEKYAGYENAEELLELARSMTAQKEYQEAAYACGRVEELAPENMEALKLKGYCEYMCGNYEVCKSDNAKVLKAVPEDAYAMSGYAMACHRLGNREEGLSYMKKAVELSGYKDKDMIDDLRRMTCS